MTRTEQLDYMYSTVRPVVLPQLNDNIFRTRPLWAWLSEAKRVKYIKGNLAIEERLMYGKNVTVTSLGKGDQIDLTPPDAITTSRWEWKYIAAAMERYWHDEHKASSPAAMGDLVADNYLITSESMVEELNRQGFADGTGNGGKDMDGLENIIKEDPTSGTVGGIDSSAQTWWRNQIKDMSADTFATQGKIRMQKMYNDCTDGAQKPDLILTGQNLHELYEQEVQGLQMVIPTEMQRNKIADLGFEALYFKRIPIFFDKDIPDVTRMYFINSNALRLIADEDGWMSLGDWIPIPNQPKSKVAHLTIIANLTTNNRRRLGVIFNAT